MLTLVQILPVTGELVLGDYMSLSFPLTPSYTPGCPTDRGTYTTTQVVALCC